jgi:hypothetical protein
MEQRLVELARELQACRKRGNKMTLDWVLVSARILAEAKELAGRSFGRWLREKGRMSRDTAYRHLRVAAFVKANVRSIGQIATLGMTKIYALSSLDSDKARRYISGAERFSASLESLSDLQFKREFRERFPKPKTRSTREGVFRQAIGALARAEQAVDRATRRAGQLSPRQRERIAGKVQKMARAVASWKVVA